MDTNVARPAVASQIPRRQRNYDTFARCLSCGRLYWRGAQAGRLAGVVAYARLAVAASAAPGR